MPSYTVEAFRWSGTGYNSQYTTSYSATITDNDNSFQGSGDSDETIQIDGGATNASGGSPYKIAVSFTDTSGNSHVEDFNFFYTSDGGWYFIAEPGSAFTVGATLGSYQSHTVGWDYSEVICFMAGTLIETPGGPRSVETLEVGELVTCGDGTSKPLTQVVSRHFTKDQLQKNEKLRPVRVTAGALGLGLPKRDLVVSRQHKLLVKSQIAERMLGTAETLVAANKLTILPGVFVDDAAERADYYHLGFEEHEIVFAEGAPAESLLRESDIVGDLSPEAEEELQWLLCDGVVSKARKTPRTPIASTKLQKKMIERHALKQKSLLS